MGLPFAGHKDNHSGLMTREQMDLFRTADGHVRPGHEWDRFEGLDLGPKPRSRASSPAAPSPPRSPPMRPRLRARRLISHSGPRCRWPALAGRLVSTQAGFGEMLGEIGRAEGPWKEVASRIVTTSPDVTVSTSLGPLGEPPRPVRPACP